MNKVMLIGNVGAEPEVRYVDQGVAVARLRLATSERGYTLPNGTQVPDRTDWHNVILWGSSALQQLRRQAGTASPSDRDMGREYGDADAEVSDDERWT